MVTIGVDPHKQTHTAAAVNELGVEVAHGTLPARPVGNGQLLEWARALSSERVWAVEDVRNVSGSLERFVIDRGERVVRLCPAARTFSAVGGIVGVRLARGARPVSDSREPVAAVVWCHAQADAGNELVCLILNLGERGLRRCFVSTIPRSRPMPGGGCPQRQLMTSCPRRSLSSGGG